jgi:hypothetical protein
MDLDRFTDIGAVKSRERCATGFSLNLQWNPGRRSKPVELRIHNRIFKDKSIQSSQLSALDVDGAVDMRHIYSSQQPA